MRQVADAEHIRGFMRALSLETSIDARVYFTGGATAILLGWRSSTIDIDVKIVPDDDRILRTIPLIKDVLQINLDSRLASPIDFIPVRPGWEERSLFIAREGKLTFLHFDLDAQALAKVERSHTQDLEDIQEMIRRQLIEPRPRSNISTPSNQNSTDILPLIPGLFASRWKRSLTETCERCPGRLTRSLKSVVHLLEENWIWRNLHVS